MIWKSLKQSLRAALRSPANALINLIGLSIGFTVFVAAFAIAHYERSYDTFFENADRIVLPYMRLPENSPMKIEVFRSFFPALSGMAVEHFSEIEASAILATGEHSISVGEDMFNQSVRFAEADFFDIFELSFVAGSAEGWRERPEAVLLSESQSRKLFGTSDSVGETITLDKEHELSVVGVFRDMPRNSHFFKAGPDSPGMDVLASTALFERVNGFPLAGNWGMLTSNLSTYLLLSENADRTALTNDITALVKENQADWSFSLFERTELGKLTDVNLARWENQGIPGLLVAQGIGLLILAIALINTISLNTARLIGRSREISLRRIVGAGRRDLVTQLFSESFASTLLALALALGVLEALLPWASSITDMEFTLSNIMSTEIIAFIMGSALTISLLSISYPVLLLSGISGNVSLVRSMQLGHSAPWIRKSLAVVQFTAVTALVLSVLTVDQQIGYLVDSAPNFQQDRVVIARGNSAQGSEHEGKLDVLENEIRNLPGVETTSQSATVPFDGNVWLSAFNTMVKQAEPLTFQMMIIDDNFLDLYGQILLAGRDFERNRGEDIFAPAERGSGAEDEAASEASEEDGESDQGATTLVADNSDDRITNVIINEFAYRQLGFTSADEAIGQTFLQEAGPTSPTLRIVGVLPDTRYNGVSQDVRPTVFMFQPTQMRVLSVRFETPASVDVAAVERIVGQVFPEATPQVALLAEAADATYRSIRNIRSGFLAIAITAIILAASGLYALAAFLGASQRREIGIRKVMGARTEQLARGLMWQFSKPVALSLVFGLPLGWWGMARYLENFTLRIDLGVGLAIQAAALTVLIAFATVLSNAIQTARTRPAEVLRAE